MNCSGMTGTLQSWKLGTHVALTSLNPNQMFIDSFFAGCKFHLCCIGNIYYSGNNAICNKVCVLLEVPIGNNCLTALRMRGSQWCRTKVMGRHR